MKKTALMTAAILLVAALAGGLRSLDAPGDPGAKGAQGARGAQTDRSALDGWRKDLESHTFRSLLNEPAPEQSKEKPADVAGEWSVAFDTPSDIMVTMRVFQENARLTGRVTMESGEIPIAGRVTGNDVVILWTVYEGGERIDLAFIGSFEGGAITGVAKSNLGEGELYAQRIGK
jgi:hypothetical protein